MVFRIQAIPHSSIFLTALQLRVVGHVAPGAATQLPATKTGSVSKVKPLLILQQSATWAEATNGAAKTVKKAIKNKTAKVFFIF
ncbi:MAG: hypothetical protein COT33_01480 [Candidatus Nealsonbacteria bacterium CG08_land_8_20_14_0_20_38_20]|uniref:Uncharacterized protein n=1 Tax=Candidatus Nealsonbacteria bacterium CG08_land_8_20_14_0_20_38_20 TaxID=1974705 RepID=A0A2H0YM11_9BACT|nr:MAG: hypothetical protein COT33_01480 [Candidatus Nealsonbacteria bacterium CG08_land_8_20_14_0_20_38_20]